jgi:hypothetical protein
MGPDLMSREFKLMISVVANITDIKGISQGFSKLGMNPNYSFL